VCSGACGTFASYGVFHGGLWWSFFIGQGFSFNGFNRPMWLFVYFLRSWWWCWWNNFTFWNVNVCWQFGVLSWKDKACYGVCEQFPTFWKLLDDWFCRDLGQFNPKTLIFFGRICEFSTKKYFKNQSKLVNMFHDMGL